MTLQPAAPPPTPPARATTSRRRPRPAPCRRPETGGLAPAAADRPRRRCPPGRARPSAAAAWPAPAPPAAPAPAWSVRTGDEVRSSPTAGRGAGLRRLLRRQPLRRQPGRRRGHLARGRRPGHLLDAGRDEQPRDLRVGGPFRLCRRPRHRPPGLVLPDRPAGALVAPRRRRPRLHRLRRRLPLPFRVEERRNSPGAPAPGRTSAPRRR